MGRKMRDKKIRQPDVICVKERHEGCIAGGKAVAERRELAAILRTHQQTETRIAERPEKLADMFGKAVGRSVIDDDAVPFLVGLRQDRADRVLDVGAIVVTGDDHANTRKLKRGDV
jgi:hypothetical protein